MHQKMTSKRNQVQRIIKDNKSYISKSFTHVDDYMNEIKLLKVLKENGAYVPKILEEGHSILLLEDLGDETLLDRFESMEKNCCTDYKDLILKLATWLKIFYSITSRYEKSMIVNDVNFRNFIIFEEEIFGIDFEQSCPGSIATDAGKLSSYALTYEPSMTQWKIDFRNELIYTLSEELNIDRQQIISEEKKEIKSMEKRRKIFLESYWNL